MEKYPSFKLKGAERLDIFTFEVENANPSSADQKKPYQIQIIFKDRKFDRVEHPFLSAEFTRQEWRVIRAVGEAVELIENMFNSNRPSSEVVAFLKNLRSVQGFVALFDDRELSQAKRYFEQSPSDSSVEDWQMSDLSKGSGPLSHLEVVGPVREDTSPVLDDVPAEPSADVVPTLEFPTPGKEVNFKESF